MPGYDRGKNHGLNCYERLSGAGVVRNLLKKTMRGKVLTECGTQGGGGGGGGGGGLMKPSGGRSTTLSPSPTILYVNICRTVMRANPDNPNALGELNDFMPYLRYFLVMR